MNFSFHDQDQSKMDISSFSKLEKLKQEKREIIQLIKQLESEDLLLEQKYLDVLTKIEPKIEELIHDQN